MITVGIIKELFFMVSYFKQEMTLTLAFTASNTIKVTLKPDGELDVWYREHHIWNETFTADAAFFLESCDAISRIVACIDNGDSSWTQKYYFSEKKP